MRNAAWIVMSALVVACASAPATQEQREVVERRLLAPFLRSTEVGCGELFVEMTGNFYGNVSQPGVDPQVHTARKDRGEDYTETVWTNTLGRTQSAFVVTIGEPGRLTEKGLTNGPRTTFTVLNRVRLRIYEGTRSMTLNAQASGPVVVVKEAAVARPRDVREFAVVDGLVKLP